MNTLKIEKSAGKILLHDITRIIPGKFKGDAFKKGHIIGDEDIPKLKDLGKEKIYVFNIPEDEYHEDEAAELFKMFAGKNVSISGPSFSDTKIKKEDIINRGYGGYCRDCDTCNFPRCGFGK